MAIALKNEKPKIIAAIPAYNEEKYIRRIVQETRKYVNQVIVVDDGSTDGTARIAQESGAYVIKHITNQGYGGAIKTCLKTAMAYETDILVILDADGQHNPKEIPSVIQPILNGDADLVIGSRFLNKQNKVPCYRKFGINVITWLYNFGSYIKVTDAQSGFRAYSRRALQTLFPLESDGMSISMEILIKARNYRLRLNEVPISCLYHRESSTLNPFTHGFSVALSTIHQRFKFRHNITTKQNTTW